MKQRIHGMYMNTEQRLSILETHFFHINGRHLEIRQDLQILSDKFEVKFDSMEKKFDGKIDDLDKKINIRIDNLEKKFDDKFSALDTKFENKFSALDTKFDDKFSALDTKSDKTFHLLMEEIKLLHLRMDNFNRWMIGLNVPIYLAIFSGLLAIALKYY